MVVSLRDDGDLVRSVGYVAIYAAYVEERIDFIFRALIDAGVETGERLSFSQKTARIERFLGAQILTDDQRSLVEELRIARDCMDERNAVIHGRVYGHVDGGGVTLKSARPERPDRPANSEENYGLANALSDRLSGLLMIETLIRTIVLK